MTHEQVLKLGLMPFRLVDADVYDTIRSEAYFRLIPTYEDAKTLIDTYDLPEAEVYVTTGRDDLILFDGRYSFMAIAPLPTFLKQLAKQWEAFKKGNQKAIEAGDYAHVFFRMDNFYRAPVFTWLLKTIPKEQRRPLILAIRQSMEYSFDAFDKTVTVPLLLATKEDAADLHALAEKDLPDTVTIYRGEGSQSTPLEQALSWTLSAQQARRFAQRFDETGTCYQATIQKEAILAYIPSEEEVLVRFEDVHDIQTITIPHGLP